MEVTGKIKVLDDTVNVTTEFRKRNVVITTEEQYPQHISVEFIQDNCELLNGCNIGDLVTIGINLKGREWTNKEGVVKYFNTIQGWRLDKDVSTDPVKRNPIQEVIQPAPTSVQQPDDLPF